MPSATATLFLNLTAIKQLCKGDQGKSILNGYTTPTSSVGLSGDFFFQIPSAYPPLYYDLFGPKLTDTGVWPSTGIRIPSTSFLNSVSTSLYASITSISASNNQTLSSLYIANNNIATTLEAVQFGSGYGYHVANFKNYTGNLFTISNSGQIGAFYSDVSTAPAQFSINGSAYIGGKTAITNDLSATGNVRLGSQLRLYSGVTAALSSYEVLSTNVDLSGEGETGFKVLSTFLAYFKPQTVYTRPFRVQQTRFEVGDGDILNSSVFNNGAYFIVDPISGYNFARGVTIHGTLTALSSYNTAVASRTYHDSTGLQILSSRLASPSKLTAGVSTSADIINAFNTLIDRLTGHGLIR